MKKLQIHIDPNVELVFSNYSDFVRSKLLSLRELIIETAKELDEIEFLEEKLKWGEPSYLTKNGSTIRIDWKKKTPDQYAIYFKCTSRLVPAFKSMYGSQFNFDGNRSLVFKLDADIPKIALKNCIATALQYHRVKHLPKLGMI